MQAVRPLEYNCPDVRCRDVVERRIHIVTGKKPSSKDVDHLIDTGESEAIFKTAIQKQGRGHVSALLPCVTCHHASHNQ